MGASPGGAPSGTSPTGAGSTGSASRTSTSHSPNRRPGPPGPDRVTAERLDVRDPAALLGVLKGADVCVNAVQYTFNLAVMEGCLADGGPVPRLRRPLPHDPSPARARMPAFGEAGLLAIPGLGQVPGVSNVLAMEATRDLDRVESVVIRDGWRDLTPNGPEVVFTWSPSTFLDEMLLDAMVFEEGAYQAHPR